jgi:flagellar protein FliL
MAEDLEEDFDDMSLGGGDELPAAPTKKLPIKKLLTIILPLLLLIGGGAGAYFSGLLDGLLGKKHDDHVEAPAHDDHAPPGGPQQIVFMDLQEMLVNLQSTGRKQSFLKIKVSLELNGPLDQQRIEQVMPRIVDSFQVYLRELRIEDLQGAAGMHLLREELLTRVNASAKPVKVNDVLFREMLIQ